MRNRCGREQASKHLRTLELAQLLVQNTARWQAVCHQRPPQLIYLALRWLSGLGPVKWFPPSRLAVRCYWCNVSPQLPTRGTATGFPRANSKANVRWWRWKAAADLPSPPLALDVIFSFCGFISAFLTHFSFPLSWSSLWQLCILVWLLFFLITSFHYIGH